MATAYPRPRTTAITSPHGRFRRTIEQGAVERDAKTFPVEAVADVKQIVLEELDAMSRHLLEVIERDHFRITPSSRVVMHDGEPVLDHGPAIQAINAYIRIIQERAEARPRSRTFPHRRQRTPPMWIAPRLAMLPQRVDKRTNPRQVIGRLKCRYWSYMRASMAPPRGSRSGSRRR
jgi:hypothetical protein